MLLNVLGLLQGLHVCEAPKVPGTKKVFSNVEIVMSTVLWIIQIR